MYPKGMNAVRCLRCGDPVDPEDSLCFECLALVATVECKCCGEVHSWIEVGDIQLPNGKFVTVHSGDRLHTKVCPHCRGSEHYVQVIEYGNAVILPEAFH